MVNYITDNTCCFLGHRKITITNELKHKLKNQIENLITTKNVNTFLFGSRSQFDDLGYDIVTYLKQKYQLKRIYVRAEYKNISKEYENGLLQSYEETYFPSNLKPDMWIYINRNKEMINKSKYCIFYYNKNYVPTTSYCAKIKNNISNSGTEMAYKYAIKTNKIIINLFEELNR